MSRIILTSFLICFLCGCFEDDYIPPPTTSLTLFEQLQSDPNYSEVAKAISKAGLDNRLSVDGPFTFFAPDNTALTNFFGSIGQTLDDIDAFDLREYLAYHIVNETILPDDFANKGFLTTLSTNDNSLKGLSVYYEKSGNQLSINNQVTIDLNEDEKSNGVIYPINEIFSIPTLENFLEIQSNSFGLMKEGFQLVNFLDNLEVSGQNTVFAAKNDAFTEWFDSLSVSTVQELEAVDPNTQFIINYHYLEDSVFLLDDLFSDTTFISMRNGVNIRLQTDTTTMDTLFVLDSKSNTIFFEEMDIQASNGIMHIIDKLMIP